MFAATAPARVGVPGVVAAPAQAAIQAGAERHAEFESVLRHALPRFRNIATRWLGNREDAEDAVQDAMLSAYTHLASFSGRAKMSTWLTAIVINAVRMQKRRNRPLARVLSLDFSLEEGRPTIADNLVNPGPTPEKTLEHLELYKLAIRLTRGLAPSQRRALRSYQQNGFSIKQSAMDLGISDGTFKAQVARGRAKLADRFRKALARPKTHSQKCGRKRLAGSAGRFENARAPLCHKPVSVLEPGECELINS